jgi:hypothetical protein
LGAATTGVPGATAGAVGRVAGLRPGDYFADPPCSAPLAASFQALLGGGGGVGGVVSGGYGSAPAPQQRRRQRPDDGSASASADDRSPGSGQLAFFLTGVDGFESVAPSDGDASYSNTAADGAAAPPLLPPWRRPAFPLVRQGSAAAASLAAANRHLVANQRAFVDCDGRHTSYQAELTLVRGQPQRHHQHQETEGGGRVINGAVLLRLAGAAARHGGDPRSATPGGTPTYGSSGHSGGGCLALPPPDMRCHPLHATHTALRGAVNRAQRVVVTEGYVRASVWKGTLRELGTLPRHLPA